MKWKSTFNSILMMIVLSAYTMATTIPTAPKSLKTHNITKNSVGISFIDTSSNEESFKVYYNGKIKKFAGKYGTNNYQYINLTELTPSTTYTINIGAFSSSAGESRSLSISFITEGFVGGCNESTAITRKELRRMIQNGEDVTKVNTCKITDMSRLFTPDSSMTEKEKNNFKNFNQDISGWDTSSVINMSFMFYRARVFNQPLEDWDVSNVTNMSFMFCEADVFNQPLENWDVSNVTNMSFMFYSALLFNQALEKWDISSVTDVKAMFLSAKAFNYPLNHWDVSNITDMSFMFYSAKSFNQLLNCWNVYKVKNMSFMFYDAQVFNQPFQGWNISNVTNLNSIFYNAKAFNQNLSHWNVSSVTNMSKMFTKSNLSTKNYDAILIAWNKLDLLANLFLGAGSTKYCQASQARQSIVDAYNWNIQDAGLCSPED